MRDNEVAVKAHIGEADVKLRSGGRKPFIVNLWSLSCAYCKLEQKEVGRWIERNRLPGNEAPATP